MNSIAPSPVGPPWPIPPPLPASQLPRLAQPVTRRLLPGAAGPRPRPWPSARCWRPDRARSRTACARSAWPTIRASPASIACSIATPGPAWRSPACWSAPWPRPSPPRVRSSSASTPRSRPPSPSRSPADRPRTRPASLPLQPSSQDHPPAGVQTHHAAAVLAEVDPQNRDLHRTCSGYVPRFAADREWPQRQAGQAATSTSSATKIAWAPMSHPPSSAPAPSAPSPAPRSLPGFVAPSRNCRSRAPA